MPKTFARAFAALTASGTLSVAVAASPAASAAPLDPALQGQLLQIFDRYNQAIAAGKIDEAMTLDTRETRDQLKEYGANAAKRRELMLFNALTTPDSFDVLHASLSKDGASASILVLSHKKIPKDAPPGGPAPGSNVTYELTIKYLKQDGAWKYDEKDIGMDPADIKPCKNPAFEPIEAYDQDRSMSMGGLVMRVAFEADYTLVVVRVVDEENCAYLPNRADLEKSGFDSKLLVPYTIVEINGYPHKSDKQKVWGDKISISDADW